MRLITFEEASQEIGICTSNFSTKGNRLLNYVVSTEGKRKLFNIDAYKKQIDLEEIMKARATQFIEYLVHEEGISYSKISAMSGLSIAILNNHSFGYDNAYKLVSTFAHIRPFLIHRFDTYYGWKPKKLNRRIKFKGE